MPSALLAANVVPQLRLVHGEWPAWVWVTLGVITLLALVVGFIVTRR